MEQNPSWEADSSSPSQEIPQILCSQEVHYRIHKSSQTCPNPERYQYNPLSHFLEMYFSIIVPSMPRTSNSCVQLFNARCLINAM